MLKGKLAWVKEMSSYLPKTFFENTTLNSFFSLLSTFLIFLGFIHCETFDDEPKKKFVSKKIIFDVATKITKLISFGLVYRITSFI